MTTRTTPPYRGVGFIQPVVNRNPMMNAKPEYYHVQVSSAGGTRTHLLLTEAEVLIARTRAVRNGEDCAVPTTWWQEVREFFGI